MIVDLEARQRALEPATSFIVQAPAGSGKTGLLVYRYLTLLALAEKPHNVLAITFTRKARSEMRERILELMLAAQAGQTSDDAFEQQGIALAQQVLQRDHQAGWRLLDTPHQMQILTIDAFSARLAASMPWLSRLGERPNTSDTVDAHFAFAVDQVLDELLVAESEVGEALKIVMHELDYNYDKARRLFNTMLSKRDQWLRHLVHNDVQAMRFELECAWAELVDDCITNARTLMSDGMLQTWLDLAIQASQRIDYTSSLSAKGMQILMDHSGQLDDLKPEHWLGLLDLLLVKAGDKVRAAPNKNTGFPAGHKDKVRCTEFFDELRDDAEMIATLAEVRALPPPTFSDANWRCLVALERVLKALAVRLQLRFRAVGECDHSEVTQRANMALADLDNPTDLGLLMDGQINHILVDEFQDTSNGQLSLLKKLTAGWQHGDAPAKTLFLVGDPMQSIYRFREADVSLFLQVADNQMTKVFDNIEIESLALSQNFRSSEKLVSWFNHAFGQSFPARNDVLTGAIRYAKAHSSKVDANQTPVEYWLANDRDQEAESLLKIVKRALSELPDAQAQIAILVRTRPQLDYLLPVLDRSGIKYAAVDIQPLHQQQAVKDAISLCQAICRDDDRLAWLAMLRGPLCGLTLAEISQLSHKVDEPIWPSLIDPEKQQRLDTDSRQRLRRFVGVLTAAKKQHQQVDLGSLTRWAWQQLGGEQTLGSSQAEDIDQVFELLNKVQRGGDLPSSKELESALEKMRACNVQSEPPRVVVSTIHKAKGLQYHTVILPGLANKPRADDRDVLMWAEHQGRDGGVHLLLAPLLFKAEPGSHYDYLRSLDGKRAHNEVMRLMYVACTRAEKKLVLLGNLKVSENTGELNKPPKNSLLASMWEALESRFDLLPSDQSSSQRYDQNCDQNCDPVLGRPLDQTLYRLPASYELPIQEDFVWQPTGQLNAQEPPVDEQEVTFEWATEVATAVGIILHDFLQFTDNKIFELTLDTVLKQRWRAELLALRVPDNRIEYALQRMVTAVQNIQTDPQARFIFDDYETAQNEYALSTLESGVVKKYRLDRTFVDHDNVRWVVDYKTTSTQSTDLDSFVDQQVEERHREQLNKYGELMRKIETRPIKLAVYFPLLKQLRAWDYVGDVGSETS